MKKERYNFTLSEITYTALKRISEKDGRSMSQIIEDAISAYGKPEDKVTKILLSVYDPVSDAIQQLEILRDYHPDTGEQSEENNLTDEGKSLLESLYRYWDELRRHPKFWEPKHPDLED